MSVIYVAGSTTLGKWGASVGISKHLYQVGVSEESGKEAVAMAEQLESGVLLSRDGDGHTAYGRGSVCVDSTIDAYLLRGTPPTAGKRCS